MAVHKITTPSPAYKQVVDVFVVVVAVAGHDGHEGHDHADDDKHAEVKTGPRLRCFTAGWTLDPVGSSDQSRPISRFGPHCKGSPPSHWPACKLHLKFVKIAWGSDLDWDCTPEASGRSFPLLIHL